MKITKRHKKMGFVLFRLPFVPLVYLSRMLAHAISSALRTLSINDERMRNSLCRTGSSARARIVFLEPPFVRYGRFLNKLDIHRPAPPFIPVQ